MNYNLLCATNGINTSGDEYDANYLSIEVTIRGKYRGFPKVTDFKHPFKTKLKPRV